MPRGKPEASSVLAAAWSPPRLAGNGTAGLPLACIASTYTFHASFLESELLPRFLGLKFDETEGVRPFIVEREQALGTARVCVLVDADHIDPSQSTLRWDQFPVRAPGSGIQHSKVVLLAWEHCARLVVSSANLTRQGYRRNREIAGVIDFHDGEGSAPRRLALDAMAFLEEMSTWVRASDAARVRLASALEDVRSLVRGWRQMPSDFRPMETPRVEFVPGLPRASGGVASSPLARLVEVWGTRRTAKVAVMTPFAGTAAGPVDPVVDSLAQLPNRRDAQVALVVPGAPSERGGRRMVVGLPKGFLSAWAVPWGYEPDDVPTYVVPLCREDEKVNRDLHAKGVLLEGDSTAMLLCGSSNFSVHGMGIRVANVEANLLYVDEVDAKRDGLRLRDRLPVDWDRDFCFDAVWHDDAEPIQDESPGTNVRLPPAFLWATMNQRTNAVTIGLDAAEPLPPTWWLNWPGEKVEDASAILDYSRLPQVPSDGRVMVQLPSGLRGANIAGLLLRWSSLSGAVLRGVLPVHVESGEDLLPPDEFRNLTANGILQFLLSGRDPAEWVDAVERRRAAGGGTAPDQEVDSLRAVDTTGYVLYRTRRLGAALAALGERVQQTAVTRDALAYRLRQDPLGPLRLAEALVKDAADAFASGPDRWDAAAAAFGIAEIMLMLAHVGRGLSGSRLKALAAETVIDIDGIGRTLATRVPLAENLRQYIAAVRRECLSLLGEPVRAVTNAD